MTVLNLNFLASGWLAIGGSRPAQGAVKLPSELTGMAKPGCYQHRTLQVVLLDQKAIKRLSLIRSNRPHCDPA